MTTNLSPRPLGDDDLEQALRGAFHRGAGAAPEVSDPWTRTTRAVRRAQIRRRTATLAAVAAVAVVGIAGATLGPPAFRADRASVAKDSDVTVTTNDILDWPLRGELSRDAGVLAGARAALDAEGDVDALLWAGVVADVPAVVAVVTKPAHRDAEGTTASIQALMVVRRQAGSWTDPIGGQVVEEVHGRVTYLAQLEDGSSDVVVLTRTDAQVALSAAPRFDDEGRVSRSYRELTSTDGVARTRVPRGAWPAISIRTVAARADAVLGGPELVVGKTAEDPRLDAATAAAVAASPRCGGGISATDVVNAVTPVMGEYDTYRQPRSVAAVWCRDTGDGSLALITVTLQDGTTFQTWTWSGDVGPGGGGVIVGDPVPVPRGAGATTPWISKGPSTGEGWYINAPGAARVDLTTSDVNGVVTVVALARPDRDGFAAVKVTAEQQGVIDGVAVVDTVLVLRDRSGGELARLSLDPPQGDTRLVDGPVS